MEISKYPNNEFESEDVCDTFLNLYNKEIDDAEADIDSGKFVHHNDVEKLVAGRRKEQQSS